MGALIVDRSRPAMHGEWLEIQGYLAQGRRGEALKVFLKSVGLPGFAVAIMKLLPVWSEIKAVAHTLPCDGAISQEFQTGQALRAEAWLNATLPVLAIAGGRSPARLQNGTRALAAVLSNARPCTLEGQTHDASAKVLAPVLEQFFTS